MNPIIKIENLTIRKLSKSDITSFAEYRAVPAVAEFQSWSDYTYEDALTLLNKADEVPFGTEGHWFQLAIVENSSDRLLGDLAVHFMDKDQVEVGFTIAPEFQNKGIARKALHALLDFLFIDLDKHRVLANTDTRNKASCRLLEKIGFRKEAHFIENIYFKGSWSSEFLFAMLQSEWISLRTS